MKTLQACLDVAVRFHGFLAQIHSLTPGTCPLSPTLQMCVSFGIVFIQEPMRGLPSDSVGRVQIQVRPFLTESVLTVEKGETGN